MMPDDIGDDQYKSLKRVLASAHIQAAYGKGTERHVILPA